MPQGRVVRRTVEPLPPVRGNVTRLSPAGNPYLSMLPGPDSPRVLDVFCGAGGMSLGFALAGFHIAAGIDADPWAMETHSFNFGGHQRPIHLSDELAPEDVLQLLGVRRVDVLVGGPPCQGFARVGRGKLRSLMRSRLSPAKLATWNDPRNSLYRVYLRFVDLLRPKFVVMENVPDMLLHRNGEVVRAVLDHLEARKYSARAFILDASHFGVPQTRKRLFIIANRIRRPVREPVATTATRPVTLRQAIGDLPVVRPEESGDELPYQGPPRSAYARAMREWLVGEDRRRVYDHVVRHYAADDQEAFSLLEEGQRYLDLPEHLRRYRSDIFDDKYHRLYWDRPAWTVTAHLAKDGYKYIHPDPGQLRTITAREAARIQSFPDWFRFAGYRTNRLRQIGNAVPPLLARAIAEVIREQLG